MTNMQLFNFYKLYCIEKGLNKNSDKVLHDFCLKAKFIIK